ncbi:MAG: GGDEF domain-containing phosphodiesterase [Thermodesulfobacteriota bacterium]
MPPESLPLHSLIENWRKPAGSRAAGVIFTILLLLAAVTAIVYYTGGTSFSWLHLMYVPIIIAAAVFRIPGGTAAALAAGLLLGPYMPLDVPRHIPQETTNWLFRILFFLIAGILTGLFSQWFNDQIDRTRQQSLHDPLTALPNHLSLQIFLRQILDRPGNSRAPVALAVIIISNLQQIIDTLSYRSANVLCLQIADRLRSTSLPQATFYKLQNNILAIAAHDLELQHFLDLCRQVTQNLKDPFYFEEIPVIINMHVGVVSNEENRESPDEMIQKASIAAHFAEEQNLLYSAYNKNFDTGSVKRLSLLGTMKEALLADELILFLQPKVAISTGKIVGAEALIRWQHPQYGLLSPELFVPEAEKTWLIHPLALFAVKAGLRQLQHWKNAGHELTLSLNLTSHNIQDRGLIAELIDLVKLFNINAANLEIEITERSLITDMKTAAEVLTSLKNIGAKISIDDFGSGYSASSYLQTLPVDAVKIDQSLIVNLFSSPLNTSLVKHMLAAARDLKLTTVAEGVESKELFDMLGEMGCDLAQGYYISKPLSENEFNGWLSSSPWRL